MGFFGPDKEPAGFFKNINGKPRGLFKQKRKLVGCYKVEWWDGRKYSTYCTSKKDVDWKINDLKKAGITAKIKERPRLE